MKKTIVIIGMIVTGFLLTFYQVHMIESAKNTEGVWLVKSNVAMPIGHTIEARDLTLKWVHEDTYSEDYYFKIEELVGKTLTSGLSKNTLMTSSALKETGRYQPENGHAITALKLTPEEALCWAFEIGEDVMVVQVLQHEKGHSQITEMGAVKIKGIYDHYLDTGKLPTFVLVEGENAVIKKIIQSRDLGRIELMKSAL